MKRQIWITFDLGIRGDYEGMYSFLDRLGAKECGDRVAVIQYEFDGDLLSELKRDITGAVKGLDRRSRVYVVYPSEGDQYKGKFLIGARKHPAWAGFAGVESDEEDTGE